LAELPTGTVTFLFTDLEGSTRLWEEHPEAMRVALARHDEILRRAVTSNQGHLVKGTGDGVHGAFAAPGGAVAAARAAQLAMSTEEWAIDGGLRVRMGIHTGVAEMRDGDYFGPALNRAARLMAIGHGSQVLLTQATSQLLDDVELKDLGEHRLRDLERPERVFQLVVPGLRADFPPLRSNAVHTNLPVHLSSFIGREKELERLRRAVDEDRLVTVVGAGGVGKTRLALHVAGDLAADFADGAWVSELGPALEPESMLNVIAGTFSVQQRPGATLEESLLQYLEYRHLLWVVDNCEHLLTSCALLVDRVLRGAPQVRIVATSREALDVDGEHLVPLRPMALAASDDPSVIQDADAVRLFVERARAVRPGFTIDESSAPTVNELCTRVDGIPLAIELAASRVVAMGVAEINELLDERFRLLIGGRRASLERHQTLRATVDWSYASLSPTEQLVFDRLSVFAGSLDATAARHIVADEDVDVWAVVDAIDGLVRKSMVIAEEHSDASVRYALLETLRQYARDRLTERGDSERRQHRHADYYVALIEEMGEGLLGPDELSWRARLMLEVDNIRIAAAWALDQENIEVLTRLVVALAEETLQSGAHIGRISTRSLALRDRFDPDSRAVMLAGAAIEAYAAGEIERARELSADAWSVGIDSARSPSPHVVTRLRSLPGIATPTQMRMAAEAVSRDWDAWIGEIENARPVHQSRILSGFATVALQAGEMDLARRCAERGYELAVNSGNPSTLAQALYERGAVAAASSDPDAAWRAWQQCIALGRQGATNAGYGAALLQSAIIPARRGDFGQACALLEEAVRVLRPRGRTPELDGVCGYAIEILALAGAHEAAATIIGAAVDGVLTNLRDMPLPPDRQATDVSSIRDVIGGEVFDECIARGAAMTYDALTSWLLRTLTELAGDGGPVPERG
jgi:predicted ATPase/class 3 adenylate cyclase